MGWRGCVFKVGVKKKVVNSIKDGWQKNVFKFGSYGREDMFLENVVTGVWNMFSKLES